MHIQEPSVDQDKRGLAVTKNNKIAKEEPLQKRRQLASVLDMEDLAKQNN